MKRVDVIIVGAGAAGLMCAIEAGKRGRSVLILEQANKPGKKILMSGGGRCNFTNMTAAPDNYISHNPHFCKSALSRYTPWHFIELVKKHYIPYHEKTLGQLFCDNKSKDILNMLLAECALAKVDIKLNTTVKSIKKESRFILKTSFGDFDCESLVIATGGLSIPTMGSSPFAYHVAEQFGMNVHPTRAGLVPFTLHDKDKEKYAVLSGVSAECVAACNGVSFREAMLFTHRGLSGPACLQISSYWNPGDALTINLFPTGDLLAMLKTKHAEKNAVTLKQFFTPYFSKRQVALWLGEDLENKIIQSCSYQELKAIADLFSNWQIKPNGTEGYRTAEVTLGGVDCDAISSKTFEAKNTEGLYFIGEALDVTGWLGGYNFQWAWASGVAAGLEV